MKNKLKEIAKKWDYKSNYLIDILTKEEKKELFMNSMTETYKKGELIIRGNHVPEYVYFIKKGSVKRFTRDKNNKEYIVQILRSNLIFGYHSVLAESRYNTFTEALEDSEITLIPKKHFIDFIYENQNFQHLLLKVLSYEFSIMINYITNYINKPVFNRVITQLLNEANYLINFKLINEQDLTFKIRRNDLAALVGASRENIILALNKLKKMDLIDSNGSFIKIKNLQTLIELNES